MNGLLGRLLTRSELPYRLLGSKSLLCSPSYPMRSSSKYSIQHRLRDIMESVSCVLRQTAYYILISELERPQPISCHKFTCMKTSLEKTQKPMMWDCRELASILDQSINLHSRVSFAAIPSIIQTRGSTMILQIHSYMHARSRIALTSCSTVCIPKNGPWTLSIWDCPGIRRTGTP